MAKITKRLNIKGFVDYENKIITEHDKDLGDVEHKLDNIFLEFNGLDDVTLSLSYDKPIIPEG